MIEIKGIVPILAAPFFEDGAVDYESLRTQLRYMKAAGCAGAALFGIAGECFKLSDAECEKMMQVTADECHSLGLACVISNTCQALDTAVARAKLIEAMGADCMMLLPPFVMKPYGSELLEHVRQVTSAVKLPVMLQYAPAQTGVPIAPDAMRALANELDNLIYFKIECKPAGPYISRFLDGAPGKARVLNGNAGYQMIEAFDRGAVGVMPGASMAKLYVSIYNAYFEGDREKAVALHNELLPMLNHIRQDVDMIIHFEKKILARRGAISTGFCRHPEYVSDTETDKLFEMYYKNIEKYL